ncbi:MAG: TrkA family potassium uptake protein [Deferribacterota bacterium]|nr:TrkA family potassium uptake protein [Deferribacterota bacterium]
MKKRDVAVIGLGIFGKELALKLASLGHNVLAVDLDEKKVEEIKDLVDEAIVADATDIDVLKELQLDRFSIVVLAMTSSFENIVLTLALLRKMSSNSNVKIYVKADTDLQAEVLSKIGADKVILPDKEVAYNVAHQITLPNLHKILNIDDNIDLVEVTVPGAMDGKSLQELDLRRKYNVNVFICKKNGGKADLVTDSSMKLYAGDILVVSGDKDNIMKVFA